MVSTNSLGFRPAKFAKKALLYELALTPSPGLVDRANTGSHTDMNFFVFLDSALALGPYLDKYYQAGLVHQGDLKALFERLRYLGAQAEEAMFQATQGINTHKGINFSRFGIRSDGLSSIARTEARGMECWGYSANFQLCDGDGGRFNCP